MKEKAYAYLRVSSLDQAEHGWGLKVQKEQILNFCSKNKLELENIFEDDGYSGADANRPGLQELLKKVKEDGVKKIIISHSSRLARDSLLSEIIYRDLRKNGVKVISVTQPDYYEAEGDFQRKLIRTMLDAFDEYEKSLIAYRLKNGKKLKAMNGGFSGFAIFGYRCENKRLVIDKKEAEVVRQIFSWWRKSKLNLSEIARRLNKASVKTKHDKKWHANTIKKILACPIYKGMIRYGGATYPGIHPKIL